MSDSTCALRHLRLICLAIGLSVGAGSAFAQSASAGGALAGSVRQPNGAAAAGAVVQAKGADDTIHRGTADAAGHYTVADLPSGAYDVTVAIPGLRAFEQKGVQVQASGKPTELAIRLEEGTQLSTLGEDPRGFAADRERHKPPAGPTPRTADGKPDFSAVWWQPVVTEPGKPEWTAHAQQVAAERVANNRKDSPQTHCLPAGVLRRGPLVQFAQTKDFIVEITDDDSPGFHQIYLNRGHPAQPDFLWYGDSVGRWEGDTLVVDRVNFIEDVWLDADAHPHSDKLHIVERYTRPDLGHLQAEITVEDPAVLAKPWTFKRVAELAPTESIREFLCENNSDLEHLVGK
jgi:hypothetical protein